ncbi:MAG: histidine--tRNA ligase [Candidatus Liptonbacteria bacterium]|nr:histidine--tRNA ligase [Candidatus Liptonbacteria bacterium]
MAEKRGVKKKPARQSFARQNLGGRRRVREILQNVRGMHDILPDDQPQWEKMLRTARDVSETYGFRKIETPIVEQLDLFTRGVGEHTDIVEKEMYILKTGGGALALRPEGTAAVARAYIQYGMDRMAQPMKLWYAGPMFRHEQPQAGRYRQLHQWGIEIFGSDDDPIYDAQVILAMVRFAEGVRLRNVRIEINSIGCRVCRPLYRKKLVEYYRGVIHKTPKGLCEDCKRRLAVNPLRLLDCKNEICQPHKEQAPALLNSICAACKAHFRNVLEYLDELKLPYTLNQFLVRGLDYYNRTVFEVFAEEGTLALAAGGRYDYLTEMIGGKPAPAVGAAAGLDRIGELLKEKNLLPPARPKNKIFLVHVGDLAKKRSLVLIEEFRAEGVRVNESFGKNSLGAQLQSADKEQASIALILGQKEVFEESIIIRDMQTGAQETAPLSQVVPLIKKKLQEMA